MKLGLLTPVVSLNPRSHGDWELDAGIEEVATVAEAADRLGFHHLTCSEHVAIPTSATATRGSRYWDPLATFGFLAARTQHIRLATHVLVLGYHHPLDIAKRYGTLDQVCNGRLILGVGVGSLAEEFDLLGAPFEDRGWRADDAILALRACLGQREPRYEGAGYRIEGFVVDPTTTTTEVPIWVGGRTLRSLERAVELGDGWVPFGLPLDRIHRLLDRARQTEAWDERRTPLEVGVWPEPALDPAGEPDRTRDVLGQAAHAGATMVNLRFRHRSLAHYLEQLEAVSSLVSSRSPS